MEFRKAYDLNVYMYRTPKPIDWDYIIPNRQKNLKELIEELEIDVMKDPRFTWCPTLIEHWWNIRKDIRVLFLHRNISHIIESRKKLNKEYHADPKRDENLEMFQIDFAEFHTKLLELEIPYQILFYPHFLTQYDRVYDSLSILGYGFEKEKGRKIWEETIDMNLVSKF